LVEEANLPVPRVIITTFVAVMVVGLIAVSVPAPVQAQGAPVWQQSRAYRPGSITVFRGQTFVCTQAHASQVGWEPTNVPALWALQSGTPTPMPARTAVPPSAPARRPMSSVIPASLQKPTEMPTARFPQRRLKVLPGSQAATIARDPAEDEAEEDDAAQPDMSSMQGDDEDEDGGAYQPAPVRRPLQPMRRGGMPERRPNGNRY
jgi:hypothetical protein